MNKVIVISPHADDETLGCGGALLRHKNSGDKIYWLNVTVPKLELGFSSKYIELRNNEIEKVACMYGFDYLYNLELPTTKLDILPLGSIVESISNIFREIKPNIIYLPYSGDIHSDHKVVFNAVISSTKWFRHPSIKRILVYETLSETEFGLNTDNNGFRPNVFVNIENYLEEKINIMKSYSSEIKEFPFPRSEEAIRSLASYRGASSGFKAAEAFMLLKEVL